MLRNQEDNGRTAATIHTKHDRTKSMTCACYWDTLIPLRRIVMKLLLIALACLAFTVSSVAQSTDEPASRDDVILYLRTMHSHDMFKRVMEVQSQSMQQLFRDQILQDKGSVPPDFNQHLQKMIDGLLKNMPIDEITQAMIPTYQKHFRKNDIEAMNAFYSSPVGQKVIEELPVVMQEGMQAAMPILTNYLSDWKNHAQQQMKQMEKTAPNSEPQSPQQ